MQVLALTSRSTGRRYAPLVCAFAALIVAQTNSTAHRPLTSRLKFRINIGVVMEEIQDFIVHIDFKPMEGDPSRIFHAIGSVIDQLSSLDKSLMA